MKITRRKLAEMIEQEVRARLFEADEDEKSNKKPKKPEKTAADSGQDHRTTPAPDGGGPDPIASEPPVDGGLNDDEDGDGKPDPESVDPTDGDGKDDEEAIDPNGNGGEDPSGAVNDEVSGKTIQAVSIEPKSQVLPGAKEVIVSFNESTDALRILVTATGSVKFFWRGQLHDLP